MSMEIDRILALAFDIAAAAPLKRGKYVTHAGIPWTLIEQLRDEFTASGIDWKAGK